MKTTDSTELISVGELVKELEGYEEKHWDWNVEITTDEPVGDDEDPPCIIVGMQLDGDGDLRIEIEEEWAGGGDYYIGELLQHLRDFDSRKRVYLAGGGLLFSIDNHGGIFAESGEDDDALGCFATAFGEYESGPTGWFTEAEKRERAGNARKMARQERMETIALAVLTAAIFFGLCYNVYALAVRSARHAAWENIGGVVLCAFLLLICGLTLYHSRDNQ